jgi:hypothetical protein
MGVMDRLEKECFKCHLVLPLGDFYKHSQMKDGRVNKCKACNKKDVTENRKDKIEYYRAYDRHRGNRKSVEDMREYRNNYPAKYKAVTMVNNAIRDKRLFKEPCEACGNKEHIHAHHDDYAKPLNVRWLCPPCHFDWHAKHGEGING